VSEYHLVTQPRAARDVDGIFDWYEDERPGLGREFVEELRTTYDRILTGPYRYQVLSSDIRRALLRRFPYAVFFAVEGSTIVVIRVLHTRRDPREWQRGRDS
jgi:plasmid stabilization system protein ParE